jgi:hypothetical protein
MGKKSSGQRRWEQQTGKMAQQEKFLDKSGEEMDPLKALSNMKKNQLIEYYSERTALSSFTLGLIYDYLSKASPNEIKKIKKNQVKNILKRQTYEEGDVLRNGIVIAKAGEKIPPLEELTPRDIPSDEITINDAEDIVMVPDEPTLKESF